MPLARSVMTLDALLAKWLGKEKAGERAEYQQFLTELMAALGGRANR